MNIRNIHRKISLYLVIPIGVILLSGIILQLRNQIEWIQPALIQGEAGTESLLGPNEIIQQLKISKTDVDQIIYKPAKNNVSLRLKSGEEIQLDPESGKVLKRAIRRTNLLIDIHQGSIIGPLGQYGVYILSGLGLLMLYLSGIYLLVPKRKK
jgi:uncharacterized iron-regulated membrane protein